MLFNYFKVYLQGVTIGLMEHIPTAKPSSSTRK